MTEQSVLSAPVTAHFAVTNRCPMGCRTCYNTSGRALPTEMTTAEAKSVIDTLVDMKVFTIAFGGGEPLARTDIFDLAAFAREKGSTPTITTNGFFINEDIAQRCSITNHIHVSLDGIGDTYRAVRGIAGHTGRDAFPTLGGRCRQ